MFSRRRIVTDEIAEWIFQNFSFLIDACDLRIPFSSTILVTPSAQFFKAKSGMDHETALEVFNDVQTLMGLSSQNYSLIRLSGHVEGVDHHNYQALTDIAGTYLPDEEEPEISYSPDHMHNRLGFIATLVHELAHDILNIPEIDHTTGEHELQTDLLCIIMGFGVIQAMGARQTGWLGYLSNESRMFALALFLTLRDIPTAAALGNLDGNLQKKLKRAFKQLENWQTEISDLRAELRLPTSG